MYEKLLHVDPIDGGRVFIELKKIVITPVLHSILTYTGQ